MSEVDKENPDYTFELLRRLKQEPKVEKWTTDQVVDMLKEIFSDESDRDDL